MYIFSKIHQKRLAENKFKGLQWSPLGRRIKAPPHFLYVFLWFPKWSFFFYHLKNMCFEKELSWYIFKNGNYFTRSENVWLQLPGGACWLPPGKHEDNVYLGSHPAPFLISSCFLPGRLAATQQHAAHGILQKVRGHEWNLQKPLPATSQQWVA